MSRAEEVLRLLLVESSLTDADQAITCLRQAGYTIRASRHDDLANTEQALTNQSWDLILCRANLPEISVSETMELIEKTGRDVPCLILVSDESDFEEYYTAGAQDIILVSDVKRLPFAASRELKNLYIRRLSRRNERALRESERRSQLLLRTSRDAVAYVHEGMYIYVNHSYLTIFGYEDEDDVAGLSILDMVVSPDHAKFKTAYRQFSEQSGSEPQTITVECQRSDSSQFAATLEFSHADVEGEVCTQLVVREVMSNSLALTAENSGLSQVNEFDPLTNLYNRTRFMAELGKAMAKADEGNQSSELLYIVIDEFQKIKEKIGLSASDVVLKGVADLLLEQRAKNEFLAHYSDQVFTLIIATGDDTHVDERAEAYRKVVDDYTSSANGKMFNLQCSIGISRITENLATPAVGLDRADKACRQAQQRGGNQVVRYQPVASELSLVGEGSNDDALYWKERVQESLSNDGFSLHYQPIVSLHGEEQELYDVLLRMKDHDGSLIEAEKFIDYIENLDTMIGIDEWVVPHALHSLAQHLQQFPKTRFFIKLSKQTLNKANFIEWLTGLLGEHQIKGTSLIFEISEALALDNLEYAKGIIAELKGLGCEFCLEHFGTGLDFSHSLNMLDVDYLKINGDFVENMAKDAENQAAVKAIIEMSKQAGKKSIAEFVSDANSLALLWRLGVDYAMGYYIQEPSAELNYNFEDDNL